MDFVQKKVSQALWIRDAPPMPLSPIRDPVQEDEGEGSRGLSIPKADGWPSWEARVDHAWPPRMGPDFLPLLLVQNIFALSFLLQLLGPSPTSKKEQGQV